MIDWAKKKKNSPKKIGKECGLVNLDDIQGSGTHTGFVIENLENDLVEYFDPFGLIIKNATWHLSLFNFIWKKR